ncbi:MAG: hypothetical protein QOJ67_3110 [Acidimicrobiaceae bacterium]
MEPADLGRLITVGDPRLSPDGQLVAFVVTKADLGANRYHTAIWVAATDGSSAPRQLTAGTDADTGPAWSPDGRRLAFSRTIVAKPVHHRLLVMQVDGPGELLTIADDREAFGGVTWSPDGTRLAYAHRVRDARLAADDERDQPPRRIDSVSTREDDVGWTVDRRRHLFVVPVDGTAAPRQVTDGPYEHDDPHWSPDGRSLAFTAARDEDWDLRVAADLWIADVADDGAVDGSAPLRRVTDATLDHRRPAWSPDGNRVAVIATDHRTIPHHAQVVVLDVATGEARTLTGALDRHCSPTPGARPPIWIDGGAAVLFAVEDHGNVALLEVAADGSGPASPVVDGERWVTGYDAIDVVLVFTASTTTTPPELFARATSGGPERTITALQSAFLRAVPALPAQPFGVTSPAGDGEVDAWMMRPPGFDPAKRYPMLLAVHGGPMSQYGNRWMDEMQLYASAGYVVVYSNPHGSSGASEAWLRAIRSPLAAVDPGTGWGGIDYDDLMAVVDAALEREPAIDPARLGVLGGSYGGYMASWIIGHTNRFAAACSERAVNNMLTLEFTSDLAATFRFEVGVDPIEQPEEFLRQSPITYARDIETPVLILHSENDLRCPVEQADQLFVTLRMLGKDVEYWRFPDEGHELSRSGAPKHRQQRAELILDYFARHLHP